MASSFKGLTINDTGYLALPQGTSANRTSNSSTLVSSFTTVGSTTWTAPSNVTSIEVLVVAGGGAGGSGNGRSGGGGGGGVIYNTSYPVVAGTSYTVVVGAGATGTTTRDAAPSQVGGNSQFDQLIAYGGGQGGNGPSVNTASYVVGQNGGCGGGGGGTTSLHYTSPAGNGTLGQGFGGGNGVHLYGSWAGGGGGGGAGSPGFDSAYAGNANGSGNGGPGFMCYITGSPVYYGGGGGGAYFTGTTLHGKGGVGGGGNGSSTTGTNGTANTGGGGGASGTAGNAGGNGGSGIVIIRYTLDSSNANPAGQTRYNTVTNTVESYGGNSAWKQTQINDGIVSNGLTLHLDAARYLSGSSWTDLSRAGNNGTLTNSPTYNYAYGGYFTFTSASSQYVAITDSDASFSFGANDYAVDAWVYPTASGNTSNVVLNQSNGGAASDSSFYLGFSTDGVAHYVSSGAGWSYNASAASKSYANGWHHVVWTRRGDTIYAYVDGGLVAQAALSNGFSLGNSSRDVQIGTQALGQYISANIAIVRVYKGRSLSETEIRQNHNAQCARFGRVPIADKPPIVNDASLVLNLDAGDRASFTDPGTINQTIGNTMFWNDLSPYGNRASIPYSNLPIFYPEYKGYLQLSGNTSISFSGAWSLSYPFTLCAWVAHNTSWSAGSGQMDEIINLSIAGQRVSFGISDNSGSGWPKGPGIFYGGTNHWTTSYTGGSANGPNDFHHIVVVVYGSNNGNHQLYIDGVVYGMTNNGGGHGGTAGNTIGANSASSEYWDGKIAQIQIYNRPLTAGEVRQNFDALRGRFGI